MTEPRNAFLDTTEIEALLKQLEAGAAGESVVGETAAGCPITISDLALAIREERADLYDDLQRCTHALRGLATKLNELLKEAREALKIVMEEHDD